MKNIWKFSLTLFVVSVISASLLSFVYLKVKGNMEKQKKIKIENAIKFVFPHIAKHSNKLTIKHIDYWKCYDDRGQLLGYAILCKKQGFSSVIKTIVGVKPNGLITKISVIEQQETPGLGAKMMQIRSNKYIWTIFSKKKQNDGDKIPYFQKQFFNKEYKNLKIVKHKPNKNNEIEALTGATISSKAVLSSIKESINLVLSKEADNE